MAVVLAVLTFVNDGRCSSGLSPLKKVDRIKPPRPVTGYSTSDSSELVLTSTYLLRNGLATVTQTCLIRKELASQGLALVYLAGAYASLSFIDHLYTTLPYKADET